MHTQFNCAYFELNKKELAEKNNFQFYLFMFQLPVPQWLLNSVKVTQEAVKAESLMSAIITRNLKDLTHTETSAKVFWASQNALSPYLSQPHFCSIHKCTISLILWKATRNLFHLRYMISCHTSSNLPQIRNGHDLHCEVLPFRHPYGNQIWKEMAMPNRCCDPAKNEQPRWKCAKK